MPAPPSRTPRGGPPSGHPSAAGPGGGRPRRCVMLAVWPLLVAAGPPAPMPPGGFAGGITGLPRALDGAVGDVRGGGFNAVRIFLRWDKIETAGGTPDWTGK